MSSKDDFVEENKDVLITEMAERINSLNEIINAVVETPINPDVDSETLRSYFIAAAMQTGSLTTLFNQYYVLLKGRINKEEKPIGFGALIEKEK